MTLLEFDSKLRADAVLQAKLGSLPNVTVITDAQTTEVTGNGEKMNGLGTRIATAVKCIESPWPGCSCRSVCCPTPTGLKGTVALSKHGEIEINDRCETSLPGVFAAVMRPPCRTSRSSSPWARAPRQRCRPSIT